MTIARARVETDYPTSALRDNDDARYEKNKIYKRLCQAFKQKCDDCNISHDFKKHKAFESKSRVRRRKKREAIMRQKEESLKQRLLNGDRFKGASRLLKKLKSNEAKNKNNNEYQRYDQYNN